MSKAAVVHMTRVMAMEWGKHGINVNALCPGFIDTDMNHHLWQGEQGQARVEQLPRKRVEARPATSMPCWSRCAPRKAISSMAR